MRPRFSFFTSSVLRDRVVMLLLLQKLRLIKQSWEVKESRRRGTGRRISKRCAFP